MRKIIITASTILLFSGMVTAKSVNKKKDKRPNIIIILADDMGFSDLGCYGGEIHTPNINYLASNGLRFSNFYNTSRSCPSRAALLTGLYNQQAGIGEMTEDRHEPGYRGYITKNTVTLAEVLKSAGYHTAMSGKWHVSNTVEQPTPKAQLNWLNHQEEHPFFSPVEQYPTNRGFEDFFGTLWGVVDHFDPFSLVSGTTPVKSVPKGYYQADAINDTAVSYIKKFSKDDQPFFLYVAHNAPHWPLMAPAENIEKYKDTYTGGWDAIRNARYKKMVSLGIVDSAKCHLSPRIDKEFTWDNNPDKDWDARAMAVHAAMIDRMDEGIGRVIKALKESGELDNTLIFVLSDNGASPEDCARYGAGFDRPGQTRDGQPIHYETNKKVMPGTENTFYSIGERWANVCNTPFRYAKAESYEGGIHTPLIAFWPKGIEVKKGSIVNRVGHVMDFMATVEELAQTNYPSEYDGNAITPLQGVSLVSALKGKNGAEHEALFNEHYGARYARVKEWKLVSTSRDTTWHLYNIIEDASELNDMATKYPDKVKELEHMWSDWAYSHNVLPKPKRK